MIRKIQVEAFLNYLGDGISRPALVIGNDFQSYVLKTQKVMENGKLVTFDCMFLNELLSYQIARYLGVPVSESAIAFLDQRLVNQDPKITFVHRFYPGIHFSSLELQNRENNIIENYQKQIQMGKPYMKRSWNTFFKNIINLEDISNILAFDLLIANFDRYRNTGNLLVVNETQGRKVYSIDHGHAFFGPKWDTNKINYLKLQKDNAYINNFINLIILNNNNSLDGLGCVFRAIEQHVDLTDVSQHIFQNVVELIENISEDLVDQWMSNIPDEWYIDKSSEISYYKFFILTQKVIVKYLIQQMAYRRAFSNYRGGELLWKAKKQSGTA